MSLKFFISLLIAHSASAMTISEYMNLVSQKNRKIGSYDIAIEAAKDKQTAGDLDLSPTLTAAYNVTSDKSLPTSLADKRDTTVRTVGLAKKFSTGTAVSLTAKTSKFEYDQPVTVGNNGYNTGGYGISVEQSLWKDFFGHATRLRDDRLSITNRLETYNLELQKRGALIEVESDFWDYVVALEDMKLKQANLERARKLENWTANRVYNGISDESDLLQVKALTSRRELELETAKEELMAREVKIRENLDLPEGETTPQITSELSESRSFVEELSNKKNVTKIETYLSYLDANLKEKVSSEVTDSMRPDLKLVGQYNTSSYNLDYNEMVNNLGKTDRPITYVGVNFSWMFGSDAKSSQISSAKKEAVSARYKADQARLRGENAWEEHLRKYQLAKKSVETLEKIAKLQRDRSKAEQVKFSKGRTITSNVVSAETDAAEAEISFLKAKSNLRKTEAATQLFISVVE